MTWSKITNIVRNQATTAGGGLLTVTSSEVVAQRLMGDRGMVAGQYSANPGGTNTGKIYLQGRLSPEAEFTDVYEGGARVALAMEDTTSAQLTVATRDIPILPEMRFKGGLRTTNSVDLNIWIVE